MLSIRRQKRLSKLRLKKVKEINETFTRTKPRTANLKQAQYKEKQGIPNCDQKKQYKLIADLREDKGSVWTGIFASYEETRS